ncbi:hypothetical protein [Shewanella sp.]
MKHRLIRLCPEFALSGLVLGVSLLFQGLWQYNELGLWLLR